MVRVVARVWVWISWVSVRVWLWVRIYSVCCKVRVLVRISIMVCTCIWLCVRGGLDLWLKLRL